MKVIKLRKEFFVLIAIFFCMFLIFRFPSAVKNGVDEGLTICFGTIIPSLFPFIALSSYITKSNLLTKFSRIFCYPSKIFFRLPDICVPCIIMSMIGGFPIGIKMTSDLHAKNQITKEQAQRMCLFCMNPGPAFVITAVGTNMLKSYKAGVIIYISLCISSFFSGVISSFVAEKEEKVLMREKQNSLQLSSLSASVTDSIQSIFSICAWVILFSSLTSCIDVFSFPDKVHILTTSILEVTKGCVLLAGKFNLSVITGIIGFGGICVHCQVLNFLKDIGMRYTYFFVSRILNGIMSGIISYIIFFFFPVETDVFSNYDKISAFSFSFSYSAFFVFIFMCIIMIFDIDRSKKYGRMN